MAINSHSLPSYHFSHFVKFSSPLLGIYLTNFVFTIDSSKNKTMVNHFSSACLFICLHLTFVPIFGELQRFHHPAKGDGSLSFLVVGDWGRRGWYNQSHVAFQMGKIGEKLDIDFVVSTGDNFYEDGLTGVNDPAFLESFKNIYTAKSLQKPWFSVLGNHDYRGDVEAQLSPKLRQIDNRWLCMRSFILDADIAEFFVDTTPFVDEYFLDPKGNTYDWRGASSRGAYLNKLLEDLASALNKSTASWKIVVGHHSMRSIGHHGDTHELVMQLMPSLEAHNVDFYVNGHDHCLEHGRCIDSKITFLTSGGGSKAWMTDAKKEHKYCEFDFFHRGQGFMSMEVTSMVAKFVFYDVFGHVRHQRMVSKRQHSSV